MIEIGKITIKDEHSISESRNKVNRVAQDLSFNAFVATRLAILTSELSREIIKNGGRTEFLLAINEAHESMGLSFSFSLADQNARMNFDLNEFFDVVTIKADGRNRHIVAVKYIPGMKGPFSTAVIEKVRETVKALSKEELTLELEKTYTKLDNSKKMIHFEKMSAVGQLTAGIAHELNNPMMGILNYIQYCLKHTQEDDRRYQVLKDAEKEIVRCADLVRGLVSFSRMEDAGAKNLQEADCATLLNRAVDLIAYRLGKDRVEIVRDFSPSLPKVSVNSNQMIQVFLNLLGNAIDALKERPVKMISISIFREGDHIKTIIKDTGGGIDPTHLAKIFDLFFTTKPTGQGTGLGLPICVNIVKAHGGDIKCTSTLGQGTQFEVTLPIKS